MDEEEQLNTFERFFFLFNGFVGAVLNSLVLLIGLLHVDTIEKPRQIIVISMTLADLLTCLVFMLTSCFFLHINRFPASFCLHYYVCIVTSQLCSCLCLLWINVDKLIFIGRPLHYYQLVKRDRVLILVALSWICLITLVITLYSFMEIKHPCEKVILSPHSYLFICLLYVVTIIVSFVISAIVYCIARNSTTVAIKANATRSRLIRRLFFVFSSTAWTFATCLPYRLLYLGSLFHQHGAPPALVGELLYFSYYLLVIGIVVNPLITIVTQRLYRYWLARYWWRMAAWFGLRRKRGNTQRRTLLVSFADSSSRHRSSNKCSIVVYHENEDGITVPRRLTR